MQETAPPAIINLVQRFADHAEADRTGRHNETQLRREFVDPLFKALGWDVDNEQGYAEAYKDVIHEDAIKVGGATKAPDYCFRVGGVRKFFVEAKKPAVDIKADPSPAFQLRRYAWSAKLPLSILTDFEETAVYDCRFRPAQTDKASQARTRLIRYDELPQRWGELAAIFAREAILKGSFDKYAAAARKRGAAEVDEAFLAEIEQWRPLLARNLALRNAELDQRNLNFAVQRTIDRIIFLRICEDRGIEPYGTLQGLTNGENVYARLCARFQRADERYNSGLFHFHPEKGRPEAPDELTPGLALDDKPLKEILTRLYYPESPYEFSVLPVDILGQVYEQFLGKVIRLTAGHRAVVEEKPEVRKAGGVYYTPLYIVEYIVRHTVGRLVAGQTPQEAAGLTAAWRPTKNRRPLSVLDPACGSGSFLLGAYQFLLDWYRDQYLRNPQQHTKGRNPRLYQHATGEYRLTTAERKRILLAHIYGVDIDSQAVETTKLSLLLKVLEGESAENVDAGLRLFHERALPDLGGNIKCGNSLIGPDFYHKRQGELFDEEEIYRVNAFDWSAEFADIMAAGGFDAVIGNPPYGAELTPEMRAYCAKWRCGSTDTAALFVAHTLDRLAPRGQVGFIIPKPFTYASNWRKLQTLVLPRLDILIDCSKVWSAVKLEQCVIVCGAEQSPTYTGGYRIRHSLVENDAHEKSLVAELPFIPSAVSEAEVALARALIARCVTLQGYAVNRRGAMLQSSVSKAGKYRVIGGKQLQRWTIAAADKGRLAAGAVTDEKAFICPDSVLVQNIVAHIQNPAPHIKIIAALPTREDCRHCVILDTVNQLACGDTAAAHVVCAVLNSRFMNWFACRFLFANAIRTMHFDAVTTNRLPMPQTISPANQQLMVGLVTSRLDLHKKLATARTAHARTVGQRQIDATDRRIDELVYELYGLSAEEIRIVEEATQG